MAGLLSSGQIRLGPLIAHRFPLDRFADAYRALREGDAPRGKVVLDITRLSYPASNRIGSGGISLVSPARGCRPIGVDEPTTSIATSARTLLAARDARYAPF